MRATQNLSRPARWSPGDPHLSLVLRTAPILVDPELTDGGRGFQAVPSALPLGGWWEGLGGDAGCQAGRGGGAQAASSSAGDLRV